MANVVSIERMVCADCVERVSISTREFITARCSVHGRPDQYRVKIEYAPKGYTAEAGSLHDYLTSFAERTLSAEDLAAEIAIVVKQAIGCGYCAVTVVQVAGEALRLKVSATA